MATTTISFSECAENHAGMERLGARAAAGFTLADFTAAKARFEDAGYACELLHLVEAAWVEELDPAPEPAYLLIVRKCGIGFHGDSERRLVVALRFGAAMPLHLQWFFRGAPAGRRVARELGHGDLYCMSGKAVGTDWRKTTIPTLRHAAGAAKYLTIPGFPAEY